MGLNIASPDAMRSSITRCGRFVAVISTAYVQSEHGQAEWKIAAEIRESLHRPPIVLLVIKSTELNVSKLRTSLVSVAGLQSVDAAKAILSNLGCQEPFLPKTPTGWPGEQDGGTTPYLPKDARLVFQLADRSGEVNGVWQRRRRSLNDRQSLFIEKSVLPILFLQLHDCARNATIVSTLLEGRAQ